MPSVIPNSTIAGQVPEGNELIFRPVHIDTYYSAGPVSVLAVIRDDAGELVYGPGGSVPPHIDDADLDPANFNSPEDMMAHWLEIAKKITQLPFDDSERPIAPGYVYGRDNLTGSDAVGWYAPRFQLSGDANEPLGLLGDKVSGSLTISKIEAGFSYMQAGVNGIFVAATLVNDKHVEQLKANSFYTTNVSGEKGWHTKDELFGDLTGKHWLINRSQEEYDGNKMATLHADTVTVGDIVDQSIIIGEGESWRVTYGNDGQLLSGDEHEFVDVPVQHSVVFEGGKLKLKNDEADVSNKFYGGHGASAPRWVDKDDPCGEPEDGGGSPLPPPDNPDEPPFGDPTPNPPPDSPCRCYKPSVPPVDSTMAITTCKDPANDYRACPSRICIWSYSLGDQVWTFERGHCPPDTTQTDPEGSGVGNTGDGTEYKGATCPVPPGGTPACRCDPHEAYKASAFVIPLDGPKEIPCVGEKCKTGVKCKMVGTWLSKNPPIYAIVWDEKGSECPPPDWGFSAWQWNKDCRGGQGGWKLIQANCKRGKLPCAPPAHNFGDNVLNNLTVLWPCIPCGCPTSSLDCDGNGQQACPEFMPPEGTETGGSCGDIVKEITFSNNTWHKVDCFGSLDDGTVKWHMGMIGAVVADGGGDINFQWAIVSYSHSGSERRRIYNGRARAKPFISDMAQANSNHYMLSYANQNFMAAGMGQMATGSSWDLAPWRRLCIAVKGPAGRKIKVFARHIIWQKVL